MSSGAFVSATIPRDRLLPGIHGLRGLAALAVMLFHVVHLAGIPVPAAFTFIAADFGKGVHLFFILSAFSLMHSTGHVMQRPDWVRAYFVKRFFRIAPLYYAIMASMILWSLYMHGVWAWDFETVVLNLTFSFGLVPWKGIVRAGWSVGVEMLFYAIFPLLLLTIRSRAAMLALVVVAMFVSHAAYVTLHAHYEITVAHYGYNWAYFSFAANLCFFALGMYAYRLAQTVDRSGFALRRLVPLASMALLGTLLFTEAEKPLRALLQSDTMLWGIGFAGLCLWQATRPSRWSANKLMEYLGERSYSLYLIHPVAIFFLKPWMQDVYNTLHPQLGSSVFFVCAALLLLPLLVLSEASYRLVELPGIRLGQRLIARGRVPS